MKLTILVDNNTFIDQYYLGEPAVSFYIEDGDTHVLFDTGYSDIQLKNAEKMGIDLCKLTHIVLSHGHDDHTRGLRFLQEALDLSKMNLIAHPLCFLPKFAGDVYIGSPYSEEEISAMTHYCPTREVYQITERLWFLGEIPRKNNFENQNPIGAYKQGKVFIEDYLLDDTALVYKSEEGIFVITGCSHSGICNIVEYAKEICQEERVAGVIGGFHLFEADEQLAKTISYFEDCNVKTLYPCHCVSLLAKAKMIQTLPVEETGVGMRLEIK